LLEQDSVKYDKLQDKTHGGHQYLIYVLKHKELLQDAQTHSMNN